MAEYIKTTDAITITWMIFRGMGYAAEDNPDMVKTVAAAFNTAPAADVVEIPDSGIGELSDGYHTFNGLYYQRMVLFAALVNAFNDKAWKSWRHEDGKPCFDGGWFIVGIDTPKGSYTYHYEDKYWNWFECEELPTAKHWDGHTEKDVTRLLTLAADVAPVRHGRWVEVEHGENGVLFECSDCKEWMLFYYGFVANYCPNCGAKMDGGQDDV